MPIAAACRCFEPGSLVRTGFMDGGIVFFQRGCSSGRYNCLHRQLLRAAKQSQSGKIVKVEPGYWQWCNLLTALTFDVTLMTLDALTTFDATARIAKTLKRLAIISEKTSLAKTSQADIGAMAGLSRKGAHDALKRLEQMGIVRCGYGTVDILCRDALEQVVQGVKSPV